MINLPPFSKIETEIALRGLLLKANDAPTQEFQNLLSSCGLLSVNNEQLQVALLSLSERLGSAASTFDTIVQEITTKQNSWISNIGITAFLDTAKNHAIDVETQIALTSLSCMFDPNCYAEKLSLCLNIAETVSHKVNGNIFATKCSLHYKVCTFFLE